MRRLTLVKPELKTVFTLVILLFSVNCATSSKRPPRQTPETISANCNNFCKEIRACAGKAHHNDLGSLLCNVGRCETGNKCIGDIDSATGKFQGPFQFMTQTWDRQCRPIFAKKQIRSCSGKDAMHDTCCSTICAAEIVAHGGIGNWPACGKRAQSELSSR